MNKDLFNRLLLITDEEKNILDCNGKVDLSDYTKRKSKKISGATYFEDGKELFFRRHPRFSAFPEHGHDFTEIMIVYSGEITHVIDGKKVKVNGGDLIVFNKFTRHSVLKSENEDIGLNILLSDKFMLNALGCIKSEKLKNFFEGGFKKDGKSSYIILRCGNNLAANNLIESLIYLSMVVHIENENILSSTLILLLKILSDEVIECHNEETDILDIRLKIISNYIKDNFVDGTLNVLAIKLGLNEQYLCRLIKKEFNKNFKEMITERRIEEAKKLLLITKLNIEEIAYAVGYRNIYCFDKTFRKYNNVNASEWRMLNAHLQK